MKTRTILLLVIFAMMVLMTDAQAQTVVFSSWASAQVRHAVEVERPTVTKDTIVNYDVWPAQYTIFSVFKYKEFQIRLFHDDRPAIQVDAGSARIILRPDDEYAILEKLMSTK